MDKYLMSMVLVGAVVAACGLTWLMRRYALSRHIVDIPNARSSHTQPTPRGGGVAFVVVFLVYGFVLVWNEDKLVSQFLSVSVAGAWIAIVGFLDDRGHIKARWRLLAHIMAAAWILVLLPAVPMPTVVGVSVSFQWLWVIFWILYLVWMLNLYNFMDGIDGLAAGQAIFVAAAGALLYWLSGHVTEAWIPLLLAASVSGFLVLNFPPARIFMGDAGSGFIGIMLAAFSVQAATVDMNLFWGWVILSGVFVVDATFTLIRRLLSGGRVYEAHRTHAYQYASRRYGSHKIVTLGVYALNVLWLLPIALWVGFGGLSGEVGVMMAYVPLMVVAFYFKAGKPEIDVP